MHKFISIAAMVAAAAMVGNTPVSAAEKRFGLTAFDRIILGGDFAVEVVTKSPLGAVVTGPADSLDRVEIDSSGGILTISDRRFGSARVRGSKVGPITIRINAANLRSASVSGAGSLTIDRLSGTRVELGLRGPGALIVKKVTADRLFLGVVGNGIIQLAGSAKTAETNVAGAANVDASGLAITDLVAVGEGAADQRFQANRTARVTLRGIGRLVVTGKAKCTVSNQSTGTVECGQP